MYAGGWRNSIICGEDLDRDLADLLDARHARSDTIPKRGHISENDDKILLSHARSTNDRVFVTMVAARDRNMAESQLARPSNRA